MKEIKMWYYRNFKIISAQKAIKLGLTQFRNVYGDEINYLNCRSIWKDSQGRQYRIEELYRDVL